MTSFVTYILAQAYGLIASQAKRLQDLLAVVEEHSLKGFEWLPFIKVFYHVPYSRYY